MRAQEIIDEEDWVEVERAAKKTGPLPEVSVRISIAALGRHKPVSKARVYLAFRGDAAEWLVGHGPRFRVGLAGAKANYLRIVPDVHLGKFEYAESVGGKTKRLSLGVMPAWPSEEREPTAVEWDVAAGYMRLRLPEDFATPRAKALPPPGARGEGASSVATAPSPPPASVAPPALPLRRIAPVAPQRGEPVAIMGEPSSGRSAAGPRARSA